MPIDPLHRLMLEIGFAAGDDLGLVLAGGYAIQAHELVDRPSKDVDFATSEVIPLPEIADKLAGAYRAAGFTVELLQTAPRLVRMIVTTPAGECEVDLLKEALQPPVRMAIGPVVSFEDAVGLKVRAIAGRSVPRDFIDVHAASAERPPLLAYGVDEERIAAIRRWAVAWRDDIVLRLASEPGERVDGFDWDGYLDR